MRVKYLKINSNSPLLKFLKQSQNSCGTAMFRSLYPRTLDKKIPPQPITGVPVTIMFYSNLFFII